MKTLEEKFEEAMYDNCEITTLVNQNDTIDGISYAATVCAEITKEEMKNFAMWKDLNYINYQMQDDRFYHKKDLLKHISEATVFTIDELISIYLHQKSPSSTGGK